MKTWNLSTLQSSTAVLTICKIFILFVLIGDNCASIVNFHEECPYSEDMSLVLPECIREMRAKRMLIRECEGVYYGPGLLHTDRDATKFWITIHRLDRPQYADDLTYSIYSKIGGFNEPGSLTVIEGCELMNLESKCILPKTKEGETHYIYLPIKRGRYNGRFWYCEFKIEEFVFNPRPRFCEHDWEYSCLVLENAVIRMRHLFIPLMNGTVDSLYVYCVFSPHDYELTKHDRREGLTLKTSGMTINGGRHPNVTTYHNGTREHHNCTMMKNRHGRNIFDKAREALEQNRVNVNDSVCFFVQMPGRHAKWTHKPVCRRKGRRVSVHRSPIFENLYE